jgi:hypothetical protein
MGRLFRLAGRALIDGNEIEEGEELLFAVSGCEPTGDIALLRQIWQIEEADEAGDPVELLGHLLGVQTAGLIVMRQDAYVLRGKMRVVEIYPTPQATGYRGRHQAQGAEGLHLLLPLH